MRIAHLADVHLDRPFVALPAAAAETRRDELFDAFGRCLTLARDRGADLITIGGDLWEEEHVRADTRKSVAYELGQLDIPVLIICGNHDPLVEGGNYMRTEWPQNVMIAQRRSLGEYRYGDVSVWAVSWGGAVLSPRLIDTGDVPRDGGTHILLVHGTSLAAPFADETGDDYLPFDPAAVGRAGFDICLAGHVHAASHTAGVVYPGSPEPLTWADTHRHCLAFVEADDGDITVDLVDVNKKRYVTRSVNCSGCASSAELEARVRTTVGDDADSDVFLRVRLEGDIDGDCDVDCGRIASALRSMFGLVIVDDATEPMLDIDRRADRKGLEGLFIRKVRDRLAAAASDDERRQLELALQAGLRALDGRDVILRVD